MLYRLQNLKTPTGADRSAVIKEEAQELLLLISFESLLDPRILCRCVSLSQGMVSRIEKKGCCIIETVFCAVRYRITLQGISINMEGEGGAYRGDAGCHIPCHEEWPGQVQPAQHCGPLRPIHMHSMAVSRCLPCPRLNFLTRSAFHVGAESFSERHVQQ